jgi:hypothetical protein
MTDRSFFELGRTVVTKDDKLLDGIFDVWFMDDGLYFLHYYSAKKEFYENVRENKWGMTPRGRLGDNAKSFFLSRSEISGRNAYPLHVKMVSAQTGIKVGSFDTHVLDLKTAGGSKIKLTSEAVKDRLGDLDVYFSGGSVFQAQEYAGHGLNIGYPAPIAFVAQLAEKSLEPPLPDGTLEEMVANRDYMDRFWKIFAMKVPGKKDREVLEFMMDRFPAKFREEILDRGRKFTDPKALMKLTVAAVLGAAALGLVFVLRSPALKIIAGVAGSFLSMFGFLMRAEFRRQSKIHAELIRKYR